MPELEISDPPVEPSPEPANGNGRAAGESARETLSIDHPLTKPGEGPLIPSTRLPVPVIVGTRPEAIKLVPLILALRESAHYEPIVISTGQHQRMVEFIFELADIKPDVTLWAGSRRSHLNERVSTVMQRFEDFCAERFGEMTDEAPTKEMIVSGECPAAVMVHGDTSSAMAAALSAFHLHVPVMHVEAGLRTGGPPNTPYPEEMNRQLITCLATMHFAPTSSNLENLIRENVPVGQIFVTGNTGIDALRWASELDVRFANELLNELCDSDERVVVVTAHRRENWGERLIGIATGVGRLADAYPDVRFVLPVHPNPKVAETLTGILEKHENVLLVDPLGYATFAKLLGRCDMVITDSGGIQEEAPALGKPVLVTRETTERIEGVEQGTLRVVGTDPDRIFAEGERLLTDQAEYDRMAYALNPYGDGRAAERIVAAIEHLILGGEPPTQFGAGYSRALIAQASGQKLSDQLRVAFDEPASPGSETLRGD